MPAHDAVDGAHSAAGPAATLAASTGRPHVTQRGR
jgi:hypothetical protein